MIVKKEMSLEELQKVNGGIIRTDTQTVVDRSNGSVFKRTCYVVEYDDHSGTPAYVCETLEEAVRKAKDHYINPELVQ